MVVRFQGPVSWYDQGMTNTARPPPEYRVMDISSYLYPRIPKQATQHPLRREQSLEFIMKKALKRDRW